MRMHRDAAHAIPDDGCSDDGLLLAARAAVGRGGRARRAARLPQRAGDGARADRDDLVPDGLRHDRRRARLLAGQVQGAGRRRPDDDRQPHGAAGAADARLHRRADRADRGATSTSTATIVGAPGLADEHLPVFDVAVGERAISHMGHIKMMGAVQPFISGAISKTVNLPETRDGRGHRRRLHCRPGASASRRWRSTATARRPRRRCAPTPRRRRRRRPKTEAPATAGRGRARAGAGCRASASRSRTSSRSPATRATSRPACTRTARSARSSSPTSARRARRCAA